MTNPTRYEQYTSTLDQSAGPVCYPVSVDFRIATTKEIDLTQITARGHAGFLSGVYLNNWGNDSDVFIEIESTGQVLVFPANSIAYLPMLSPNPQSFKISSTTALGKFIIPIFYNSPIPPFCVQGAA